MADNQQNVDRKGKRKMSEVDIEPRIHWFPYEHIVSRLPYGIAFPQGCESPNFRESFDWYLKDMQHNMDVKIEECLQQDNPPGVVHELLINSPVERLIQFFKQSKPSHINQDNNNQFLRSGVSVEHGGCKMHGNAKRGKASAPVTNEDDDPIPYVKPVRAGSDDDDWVLYAYHPKYGPFEVHEGIAIVTDRFLVSGLSRIGFQSITLPVGAQFMVWQLAAQPWHEEEPMHFPVLDALCLATGRIGRAVFAGVAQPATDPAQPMNASGSGETKNKNSGRSPERGGEKSGKKRPLRRYWTKITARI
ncbi:hypothetical protein MKW98_005749 [Papaver atlanticum]|uniref:Uncharacterized protein n=1 Tax=Papaver atlanticum TaxID=357466 RepID=A0AAD4RZB3_9MAGN|nr:hypothetical protein MKW98_005749 [Papaver atlanticum]